MNTFVASTSRLIEGRAMLRLAGPLIVNNLSIAGMQTADAVMAGRLGARSLAAVAVGGSVWFLGFTVCLGLLMALSPIAARHYGGGRLSRIGRYTRQGLWLAVVFGFGYIGLARLLAGPLLEWVGIDEAFRSLTVDYVHTIVLGAPGIFCFLAFRFTTEGIGHTKPIMYTSILAFVSNVFLNYVFMYGHFGAPAMGAVGCAVASAITMWLIMIVLGGYLLLTPRYRPLKIFARFAPLRLPVLREIVALGLPIAITITAEVGLFSGVSVLVGTRGPEVTAAHQVALNFASTMFMIPLALSSATTIRSGHALGARNPAAARYIGYTGIMMCALFMTFSALVLLVFRDFIVSLYTSDPAVQSIAISMLLMAAIFQVADGVQIGAAGALRGFKDTRVPMVINMVAYWALAFPLSYVAAVTLTAPPAYIWGGFVIGLSSAALMLTLRFDRVSRLPAGSVPAVPPA